MASQKPDAFQVGSFGVVPQASPVLLAEKLNRLREAVDQCRLQPGVGYTVSRSSGGTTLSIQTAAAGGSAPEASHPWKVTLGQNDGEYFYTVESESILTGNFAAGVDGVQNLQGQIPLGATRLADTYFAVLRLEYDAEFIITRAFLAAYSKNLFPGVILPDPPTAGPQYASHTILAKIKPDGTVVQAVRGDLYVTLVNNQGYPAALPVALLDYPDLYNPAP